MIELLSYAAISGLLLWIGICAAIMAIPPGLRMTKDCDRPVFCLTSFATFFLIGVADMILSGHIWRGFLIGFLSLAAIFFERAAEGKK